MTPTPAPQASPVGDGPATLLQSLRDCHGLLKSGNINDLSLYQADNLATIEKAIEFISHASTPPATVTEVAEIEKRHDLLQWEIDHDEPVDLLKETAQLHADRARLLQIIKSTAGTQEPESSLVHPPEGTDT